MKKLVGALALAAGIGLAGAAQAAVVYVGSYQVDQGPYWGGNPAVYSAAEAAALLFGGVASDYDISTVSSDASQIDHLGWYSTWGVGGGQKYNEDYKLDLGAPGYNAPGGTNTATSAYVWDNAQGADYTNYVFRVTGVPEPATWAMMIAGFGLAGTTMRRRRVQAAAA